MGKADEGHGAPMSGTSQRGGGQRPALPAGRDIWLPGRGRTFVREAGGPPGAHAVVLLHGWSATADLNWFSSFGPLARHFRLLALDHRGHGRGLRSREPFRLEACADDVAALLRAAGVERGIAVGYSMGGPIAQLLWQRHPDLVDGLVMCATGSHFAGHRRARVLFGVAAGTSALGGVVPLRPCAGVAVSAWCRWQNLRRRPWWGFEDLARHDWAQIVEAAREIGRFDSRHWVKDVTVPTAVIVTEDDDVVPTSRQLAFAAEIPGATVRRVPGGHAACTVEPDRFVSTLVDACVEIARRAADDGAVA
jgi:pimeloyl-ACP methyl ester carboxylesterase